MTALEMYDLLSEENKKIVNQQIEILIASQSDHQQKLDSHN